MSVPSWWSDSILEPGDSAITIADVETGGVGIITKVRLELVTNGNWTEPSANLFQSPSDSAGRFFDILFTRIDQDTMEIRVRDYAATTLYTRRIDINVTPATTLVEFYWGNNYLHFYSRRTTAEAFYACLLDPSVVGGIDSDLANRLVSYCHRSTAGTAVSMLTGTGYAFDNGSAATDARSRSMYYLSAGSSTAFPGIASRELYYPLAMTILQGASQTISGASPGQAFGPDAIATDTVKNIPVDTGTKLAFIALPPAVVSTYGGKGFIRKPSVDP